MVVAVLVAAKVAAMEVGKAVEEAAAGIHEVASPLQSRRMG